MAEPVDETGIVKIVLVQDLVHNGAQKSLITGIVRVGDDLLHHLVDADVGAAVLGTFERADGTADRGVQIGPCRTHNDIGKSGVVAAAVIRVDHQDRVEDRCLPLRKLPVASEHVKNVLCDGILGSGVVDDQRLPVKMVHLGKIGIAPDGRELGHEVNALEQSLIDILRIRILSVIIKRDRTGLKLVHQIPGRSLQNIICEEIRGKIVAGGDTFLEIIKLGAVGKVSEQQEKYCLFVAEMALPVLEQILNAVAPVDQVAFAGDDVPFLVLCVSYYIADFGQADPDAGTVFISKSFLDIVLPEERVWDICIVG